MDSLLVAIESNAIGPVVPYTFKSLVIGDGNRFAIEVARTFAQGEALGYSPLVVSGATGLGKTHLEHAIELEARDRFPERHRRRLSSSAFISLFTVARRDDRIAELREELAALDLLLLDDFQELLGTSIAGEIGYIVDRIQERGGQVCIACDSAPALGCDDPRLSSRLAQGMVVEIRPPDLPTRMAIVYQKGTERGIDVPDDVVSFIARHLSRNVREIEGALNLIIAHGKVYKREIDLALAEDVVLPMLPAAMTPRVTVDRIKAVAAQSYRVDVKDIDKKRRDARPVEARHLAMYLSCQLTDSSLPTLARAFNRQDHSTVMYARNKIEQRIKGDPEFARYVRTVAALCQQ